jgi:hypothetical protein
MARCSLSQNRSCPSGRPLVTNRVTAAVHMQDFVKPRIRELVEEPYLFGPLAPTNLRGTHQCRRPKRRERRCPEWRPVNGPT